MLARLLLLILISMAASCGSCTMARPPQRLIASSPDVPSLSSPLSTTPITRVEQQTAAERNRGSIAGDGRFSRGPRRTCR